ncbi:MAG: hypothetical protein DRQ02_12475 [Candidatus Latescibacterota bacterium]|nr:MAG: hypothetical protein DRQ02_12475 [Candidatus Latescibacterota bacterium]
MKSLVFMLIFLVSTANARMLVKIYLHTPKNIKILVENGVDVVYYDRKSLTVEAVVKDSTLLTHLGFKYDVKIKDTKEWWEKSDYKRDFGPYYTYNEVVTELDNLHALYPDLISEKFSIGQSWEGREIWAVKISDNVGLEEDEPTIVFHSAIHAREPGGVSVLLGFIKYLLFNYDKDSIIRWLLNNREIYVIPVVNPDGYVYNESSDGYWRKNKRDNDLNGYFNEDYDGVDLNRNFSYQWGGSGSSNDPSSDIYRGPYPFSEPETQALRDFINTVNPRIVINYHTYSNLILFPWGYENIPTPDDSLLRSMARYMSQFNGYDYGRPGELLYIADGVAIDWEYGDTSHPKILPFTFEVGEAFWQPDTNVIVEQIAENLEPNLFLIKATDQFIDLDSLLVVKSDSILNIYVRVTNFSPWDSAYNVRIHLESTDPSLGIVDSIVFLGDIPPFPKGKIFNQSDAISVIVPSYITDGYFYALFRIESDNGFSISIRKPVSFGLPDTLYVEDFESDVSEWSGDWGLTTSSSHSPSHSMTDSPAGNYPDDATLSLIMSVPVNLVDSTGDTILPVVGFWQKYDLEAGYDFGTFSISWDGKNYRPLLQITGTHAIWEEYNVEVGEIRGDKLYLKFCLTSDYSVNSDGWYVDDVYVLGYKKINPQPGIGEVARRQHGELLNTVIYIPGFSNVRIYTVEGRLMGEIDLSQQKNVPLGDKLPSGVYFLEYRGNRKMVIYKKMVVIK